MKDVIYNPNKNCDYKRSFLRVKAVKFPNVFKCNVFTEKQIGQRTNTKVH